MIRVKILKDQLLYVMDYEAWLTGWVVLDGVIHGMVFTDDGDIPWAEPSDRIEMTRIEMTM